MNRYDYIKLMQMQKCVQNHWWDQYFEGRIACESKIVKIHWKYVSFFAPRNRHVRQTIGNVMPAQRCRIEEINLK